MKIVLSAPEVSGDMLASQLIPVLRECYPDCKIIGLVGDKCSSLGVTQCWDTQSINVMGFAEVFIKLIPILKIRRSMLSYCIREQVNLFIGIDSPDFNFPVEKKLKQNNIKTIHFVSPSIWAWRMKRIHTIKQSTDIMLCLLPFEPQLYHNYNINAHFVGHPLVQLKYREDYLPTKKILLMPGSRKSEVEKILPIMVQTATNILSIDSEYCFHIALAHESIAPIAESWSMGTDITYSVGDAHAHIADSDLVVVASGTAALEVALIGTPMVVVYKMHPLTYRYTKKQLTSKYVSLPNIILQQQLVIELIQDEFNQINLVNTMFDTMKHADAMRTQFIKVRELLTADFNTEVKKILVS